MMRAVATALVLAVFSMTAAAPLSSAAGPSDNRRLSVVELFTSQGCSSCPAADALLAHLSKRRDLMTLSYNVDYWDYLGWKDTLARPAHTRRQRAYATARGDGQVYTPQAVVNGLQHAIGSHAGDIDAAVTKTRTGLANIDVSLSVSASRNDVVINLDGTPPSGTSATIFVAAVKPEVKVKIKRGENSGRRATYHNVVRTLVPVGMWTGGPKRIRLPRRDIIENNGERCAILIQSEGPGAILAAAWMPD